MKTLLLLTSLLTSLLSLNAFAVDNIKFQIEHLHFAGDEGSVTSKEIEVGAGGDSIGFKSDRDLFEGTIGVKATKLLITGTNGMFIKSSSPVELKDIPETEAINGLFVSTPTGLAMQAEQLRTSVSNIALNVSNLLFNCTEGGSCNASASQLIIDNNMKVASPTFTCASKANCIDSFILNISNLDDGKSFIAQNVTDKSFISLKDLRSVTLKRAGKKIDIDGKVHVLVGVLGFEAHADIVTLNKDILELHLSKVKISDLLSVTDFTTYLVKKLISSKSFTMNGDNIVIKLR